jgi:hypothetical protein
MKEYKKIKNKSIQRKIISKRNAINKLLAEIKALMEQDRMLIQAERQAEFERQAEGMPYPIKQFYLAGCDKDSLWAWYEIYVDKKEPKDVAKLHKWTWCRMVDSVNRVAERMKALIESGAIIMVDGRAEVNVIQVQ